MPHLAVDPGTHCVYAATLDGSGAPTICPVDGQDGVPSAVYLDRDTGEATVGRAAEDLWADPGSDPGCCFTAWKPEIGSERCLRPLQLQNGNRLEITPEWLTTALLGSVLEKIQSGIGGQAFDSVLFTIPHFWRTHQPEKCLATREALAAVRIGGRPIRVQDRSLSEPVAAGAHWVYQARQAGLGQQIEQKVLLVLDIGAGTFDVSALRVGALHAPLVVEGASNIEVAGNFATLLLLAEICQQFNAQLGTTFPTTAEALWEHIQEPETAWLRAWFLETQRLKHAFSIRLSQARGGPARALPLTQRFVDPQGRTLPFRLGHEEFRTLLEPFFALGRELVQRFLADLGGVSPFAVVLAGGGARLWGVREHILEPALTRVLGDGREVASILSRLPANVERADHAIALGAALIANDVISVQERLVADVGIIAQVTGPVAHALGLRSIEQEILLTPLLRRGAPLPSGARSSDLGLMTWLETGRELALKIAVATEGEAFWIEDRPLPHPGGGLERSVEWVLSADSDGLVRLDLDMPGGQKVSQQTTLHNPVRQEGRLRFGDRRLEPLAHPRVTPGQLKEALRKVAGGI